MKSGAYDARRSQNSFFGKFRKVCREILVANLSKSMGRDPSAVVEISYWYGSPINKLHYQLSPSNRSSAQAPAPSLNNCWTGIFRARAHPLDLRHDTLVEYFHKHVAPIHFRFRKGNDERRFVVTNFVLSVPLGKFLAEFAKGKRSGLSNPPERTKEISESMDSGCRRRAPCVPRTSNVKREAVLYHRPAISDLYVPKPTG